MECTKCGACCIAPDIAALHKPVGVRCPHLRDDHLCAIYDRRPQVCRDYQADEICTQIDAPTLEERVARYLKLFDIENEIGRLNGQPTAAGSGSTGLRPQSVSMQYRNSESK